MEERPPPKQTNLSMLSYETPVVSHLLQQVRIELTPLVPYQWAIVAYITGGCLLPPPDRILTCIHTLLFGVALIIELLGYNNSHFASTNATTFKLFYDITLSDNYSRIAGARCSSFLISRSLDALTVNLSFINSVNFCGVGISYHYQ